MKNLRRYKSAVSAALAALVLMGCSHADWAQGTDSATTAAALGQGFVEGNPVWGNADWPVIAASKIALTQVVKQTPQEVCEPGLMGLTVAGYSGALWNIGVMAGSGVAALPVVVALALWQWEPWKEDAKLACKPEPCRITDEKTMTWWPCPEPPVIEVAVSEWNNR